MERSNQRVILLYAAVCCLLMAGLTIAIGGTLLPWGTWAFLGAAAYIAAQV